MRRILGLLFLLFVTGCANMPSSADADATWQRGQPWPTHSGTLTYPWEPGWNIITLGFVHKVYDQGEAAKTVLKDISYARGKGASAEFCMFKKGVFNFATICFPALVDPEIVGSLQEEDIVSVFYVKGGNTEWTYNPGSDGHNAFRIFQKLASGEEANNIGCWMNHMFIVKNPVEPVCLQRVDVARAKRLLARDFGPNPAATLAGNTARPAEQDAAPSPAAGNAESPARPAKSDLPPTSRAGVTGS